jgi:hypothetical protein
VARIKITEGTKSDVMDQIADDAAKIRKLEIELLRSRHGTL